MSLSLKVNDAVSIEAATTIPLPKALAGELRALCAPGPNEVARVGAADAELGDFIGASVVECLRTWGSCGIRTSAPSAATARRSATIQRQRPEFTVQIGDPNRIAEATGIDTVADFRRRDMAAGGEGAPLAPLFHAALFRHPTRHRVVVNIGGIANATLLSSNSESVVGFDTGPGNALLDAWIRHCRGEAYDADGAWARSGTVHADLLTVLQGDPFVARQPPKSTGKETYHLGYVQSACRDAQVLTTEPTGDAEAGESIPPADVQTTLAEFSAWSIAQGVRGASPFPPSTSAEAPRGDVVLCGGGRRNTHLVERLAANLDGWRLLSTDDLGYDGDALEAAAFAWFAHRTLEGLPSNAPSVTGALKANECSARSTPAKGNAPAEPATFALRWRTSCRSRRWWKRWDWRRRTAPRPSLPCSRSPPRPNTDSSSGPPAPSPRRVR